MRKLPIKDLEIALLGDQHDRAGFACGEETLDRYLRMQAGQDVQRKANGVFVLTERDAPARIVGYYTLCATALSPGDVPEAARKQVPRYPLVSATLIGRLAVAKASRGRGVGSDPARRRFAASE